MERSEGQGSRRVLWQVADRGPGVSWPERIADRMNKNTRKERPRRDAHMSITLEYAEGMTDDQALATQVELWRHMNERLQGLRHSLDTDVAEHSGTNTLDEFAAELVL